MDISSDLANTNLSNAVNALTTHQELSSGVRCSGETLEPLVESVVAALAAFNANSTRLDDAGRAALIALTRNEVVGAILSSVAGINAELDGFKRRVRTLVENIYVPVAAVLMPEHFPGLCAAMRLMSGFSHTVLLHEATVLRLVTAFLARAADGANNVPEHDLCQLLSRLYEYVRFLSPILLTAREEDFSVRRTSMQASLTTPLLDLLSARITDSVVRCLVLQVLTGMVTDNSSHIGPTVCGLLSSIPVERIEWETMQQILAMEKHVGSVGSATGATFTPLLRAWWRVYCAKSRADNSRVESAAVQAQAREVVAEELLRNSFTLAQRMRGAWIAQGGIDLCLDVCSHSDVPVEMRTEQVNMLNRPVSIFYRTLIYVLQRDTLTATRAALLARAPEFVVFVFDITFNQGPHGATPFCALFAFLI